MLSLSPRTALVTLLLSPLLLDPSSFLSTLTPSGAGRIAGSSAPWGILGAQAAVTVYTGAAADASSTVASAGAQYTGLPAYDPTTLTAPAPPSPATTAVNITLFSTADALVASGAELSVNQRGNFLGFSVELSVANTIIGSTPTNLKVPFLNYLANIRTRAGQGAIVRVGGNSQEGSTLFLDGLDGSIMDKIKVGSTVTSTPLINYSPNLFYAMANVTAIVGTQWYFGLAFNQSDVQSQSPNIPLAAHYAQTILGDNLIGLQMGNEPDLYSDHQKRDTGYSPTNFTDEFDQIKQDIISSGQLTKSSDFLVGPSVCCDVDGFYLADVFNAGWLTQNVDSLAKVAVQHYPTNNCQINGNVIDAQSIFQEFLNHTLAVSLTQPYLDGTRQVLAAGKDMVMLEMNTASCGGFAGLSDSFGAAMWMTDYALQMAYRNFTTALMHVGGQNVYYNPFTPPPTGSGQSRLWTTGSVYYSTLIVAEAFGQSNQSQIVDLNADNGNIYTPAYAIYENGAPTRLVLFNFVTDNSGASNYQATVSINGGQLPNNTVSVRYFSAPDAGEKYNITWAGQTLGTSFASDGRLYGSQQTVTINCDASAQTCTIPVYAPSIAVVFLTEQALELSSPAATATQTYATTVVGDGSATVDPAALSTSNGQMGNGGSGSTSSGSSSAGQRSVVVAGAGVLAGTLGLVALMAGRA